MAYVITNRCAGTCDTGCVDVCPCDCIHGPIALDDLRAVPASDRARRFPGVQLFIDPEICIDCGACEPECPVDAIAHEDAVPDARREDIAANAAFFRGLRGPAAEAVAEEDAVGGRGEAMVGVELVDAVGEFDVDGTGAAAPVEGVLGQNFANRE